jgi:hypothetical protein
MTLRKRIDRLDRGKAPRGKAPVQIVLYGVCPETGERLSAAIAGGAYLTREAGEPQSDVIGRVADGAALTLFVPDTAV